MHTEIWGGDLSDRNHLEDLGVEGSIILKCIFNNGGGGMDWIALAVDRDRWLAVMNAVMNR